MPHVIERGDLKIPADQQRQHDQADNDDRIRHRATGRVRSGNTRRVPARKMRVAEGDPLAVLVGNERGGRISHGWIGENEVRRGVGVPRRAHGSPADAGQHARKEQHVPYQHKPPPSPRRARTSANAVHTSKKRRLKCGTDP